MLEMWKTLQGILSFLVVLKKKFRFKLWVQIHPFKYKEFLKTNIQLTPEVFLLELMDRQLEWMVVFVHSNCSEILVGTKMKRIWNAYSGGMVGEEARICQIDLLTRKKATFISDWKPFMDFFLKQEKNELGIS